MFLDHELLGQTFIIAIPHGGSHPVSFVANGEISTGFRCGGNQDLSSSKQAD